MKHTITTNVGTDDPSGASKVLRCILQYTEITSGMFEQVIDYIPANEECPMQIIITGNGAVLRDVVTALDNNGYMD